MIPIFNFLRAFACFCIVFTHTGFFAKPNIMFVSDIRTIASGVGMSCFFFITGFLIPLSLDKIEQANASHVSKNFLIRRAFRLLPVLVFCIAVYIVVNCFTGVNYKKSLYKTPYSIFLNFLKTLFAVDFIDIEHFAFPAIGVAWSLAVEYKFYFIVALAWLCFKDARSRLYGMFAFVGLLLAMTIRTKGDFFLLRSNITLIYICLVGSTTYFYYFKKISKREFLLLLLASLLVTHNSIVKPYYAFGTLFVTIVVLKFSNFGKSKIFKFFADISYSMYLLHLLIMYWIFKYSVFTPKFQTLSECNKLFCCLATYFIFSPVCYLIYRFIEKPFIKLGYKLTGGVKKI